MFVEEIERLVVGIEQIELEWNELQLNLIVQMSDRFETIETWLREKSVRIERLSYLSELVRAKTKDMLFE